MLEEIGVAVGVMDGVTVAVGIAVGVAVASGVALAVAVGWGWHGEQRLRRGNPDRMLRTPDELATLAG